MKRSTASKIPLCFLHLSAISLRRARVASPSDEIRQSKTGNLPNLSGTEKSFSHGIQTESIVRDTVGGRFKYLVRATQNHR